MYDYAADHPVPAVLSCPGKTHDTCLYLFIYLFIPLDNGFMKFNKRPRLPSQSNVTWSLINNPAGRCTYQELLLLLTTCQTIRCLIVGRIKLELRDCHTAIPPNNQYIRWLIEYSDRSLIEYSDRCEAALLAVALNFVRVFAEFYIPVLAVVLFCD